MCSPVDGKILRHGDVDNINCTIDCIKGHDYRLDEFLFGFKTVKQSKDEGKRITMVEKIIDSAEKRSEEIKSNIV
jgi:phosphatidylserine decarboxylase